MNPNPNPIDVTTRRPREAPTTSFEHRLATPLPRTMQYMRRDTRGIPVPHIVMWDQKTWKPLFTINDSHRVADCLKNQRCGICGGPLHNNKRATKPGIWFVGSALCFLHPQGGFLDPGMHFDCAEYALKVCPYLAVRGYGGPEGEKLIADRQAESAALPEGTVILKSPTLNPNQPEIFGLGCVQGYDIVLSPVQGIVIKPRVPWSALQFWSNGRRLDDSEWEADRENYTVRLVRSPALADAEAPS